MNEFTDVASKLGVPVAVMGAMGLFFWRVAAWFAPRADRLIDAHIDLVESIKSHNEEITEKIQMLAEKSVCRLPPGAPCQIPYQQTLK